MVLLCQFSPPAFQHLSTVRKEEEILLYALLKGYKFSMGKIIENSIIYIIRISNEIIFSYRHKYDLNGY